MTDLGTARKYLGIEIHQSSDGISLCQQEYANKVLCRFRMENSHDALSPMDPNVRLTNTHCEDKPVLDRRLYLSIVGSLMYAALGTGPDLSFCVTALSRYNTTPLQMHLTAAKRALRYLKRTASYRLHYPRRIGLQGSAPIVSTICGFSDSDWAGNEMTRKSVGGCIFFAHAVADRPSERFRCLVPSTGSQDHRLLLHYPLWRLSTLHALMPSGRLSGSVGCFGTWLPPCWQDWLSLFR